MQRGSYKLQWLIFNTSYRLIQIRIWNHPSIEPPPYPLHSRSLIRSFPQWGRKYSPAGLTKIEVLLGVLWVIGDLPLANFRSVLTTRSLSGASSSWWSSVRRTYSSVAEQKMSYLDCNSREINTTVICSRDSELSNSMQNASVSVW